MLKKIAVDISPLRNYPDFRRLWSSGLISYFGSMITYVALPFQIKELTNSYIAVGLMGAVELIPLIIFGLYGGVLADRVDRRKMILITEFALMIMTFSLFINTQLEKPSLIWIYVVAGSFAALDGLQRPSADAILPRIVGHEDLPSASALMSLRWQTGVITGPALAGILLATTGIGTAYLVDVITFAISIVFILRVKPIKPIKKRIRRNVKHNFLNGRRHQIRNIAQRPIGHLLGGLGGHVLRNAKCTLPILG